MSAAPDRCPCGSGHRYDSCCGRLHRGDARATTAEQLMRSRFSAFSVGDADYLRSTWQAANRPSRVRFDPGHVWVRLDIVDTSGGGPLDTEGIVEFDAHYEHDGVAGVLHERSAFTREDGAWSYVGRLPTDPA